MEGIGAEVSQKVRSAIKAKLLELGAYVDEELPDYIMVMVANKRTKLQMDADLRLFLGENTDKFTIWLHQVLKKLQEVTLTTNAAAVEGKKVELVSSPPSEEPALKKGKEKTKRKPAAANEENAIAGKKGKKRKLDKDKGTKEDSTKQTVEKKTKKDKSTTKDKPKAANSEKKMQGNVVTKVTKPTLSTSKPGESSALAPVSVEEKTEKTVLPPVPSSSAPEPSGAKRGQKISSAEMFQLESENPWDTDEEDADFINLKADTEADDLLGSELLEEGPKEATLKKPRIPLVAPQLPIPHPPPPPLALPTIPVLSPPQTQKAQVVQTEPVQKAVLIKRSLLTSHKVLGVAKVEPLKRVISLKDVNTFDSEEKKTPVLRESIKRPILGSPSQLEPPSKQLDTKKVSPSPPPVSPPLLRLREKSLEANRSNRRSLTSRVGAVLRRDAGQKDEAGSEKEDEYDPTNPSVGNVASVVRVKARPKVPASQQANKNLLLRAMAEAHRSMQSSLPVRKEPKEPMPSQPPKALFTRHYAEQLAKEKEVTGLAFPRVCLGDSNSKREQSPPNPLKREMEKIVVCVERDPDEDVPVVKEKKEDKSNSSLESMNPTLERIVQEVDVSPKRNSNEVAQSNGQDSTKRKIQNEDREESPSSSPQFVVTLDGIDPTSLFTQEEELEDYEEEEESSAGDSSSLDRSALATNLKGSVHSRITPPEFSGEGGKKVERCKYWPACKQGDKCQYHHPTVSCKSFPNCKYGDKCLYIHPNCKYDAMCTRAGCPFTHATRRSMGTSSAKQSKTIKCRFFPTCTLVNCPYYHPKMCRFGSQCSRSNCSFSHPPLPSKSQLKWVAPGKTT